MGRATLRSEIYRFWMREVGQRWVIPRVAPRERVEAGLAEWKALVTHGVGRSSACRRIWFHAASVGELESLWPVVLESAREMPDLEVVLTVFSRSARGRLDQLRDAVLAAKGRVSFAGYSPWEGSWTEALVRLEPEIFVTAKYEAWPELWGALARMGIPLVIVGARLRRSLRVCRGACRALGLALPDLTLLPVLDAEVEGLASLFPLATVISAGEPRWDQVFARSQRGNSRARDLIHSLSGLSRPWGILGSAWMEDLEVWKELLSNGWEGTLWVVPHRVDPEYVARIESFFAEMDAVAVRTSTCALGGTEVSRRKLVLVDEMGFLSELYAGSDWAYVGGGFGAGVHSTIEPAIHGIPIAAGRAGSKKFAEITELQGTRQLSLVSSAGDLQGWLDWVRVEAPALRQSWLEQARGRRGATRTVVGILRQSLATQRQVAGNV